MYIYFCFNDTSTTEIYTYLHTLSLHDALPISSLRITAQAGKPIELRSGPDGADALEKLGLEPAKLQAVVANTGAKRPLVQPGGNYSLELSEDRKSTRLNSSH